MATKVERSSFLKLVGRLVLWVGIPLVALAALFVVLSRLPVRPYLDAVRALNKRATRSGVAKGRMK